MNDGDRFETPLRRRAGLSYDKGAAQTSARSIAVACRASGETVAVAETSAGGLISAALISVEGASSWFAGSVVPYGAVARLRWLGVGDLPTGAVSEEMAIALAESVRRLIGSTWGIGETGIAGPQHGRRSRKPAGLGYVAVAGPGGTVVERVMTGASETSAGGRASSQRASNQQAFATWALALLARCMVTSRQS
jgi:nicotinamide-nucleotide amidase